MKEGEKVKLMNYIKKIIILVLSCIMIINNESLAFAMSDVKGNVEWNNKEEPQILTKKHTDENTIIKKIKDMIATNIESNNVIVDDNYITVYNMDTDISFDLYKIMNLSGDTIMLAQVAENEYVSLCYDVDLYYNIVNTINNNGKYIVYISNGIIYTESKENKTCVEDTGYDLESNNEFVKLGFSSKINKINEEGDSDFNEIDSIKLGMQDDGDDGDGEYDDILLGVKSKYCNIKKFVGQGDYNLCWAASVATIVNYKKNRNISAKTVANMMGIDYNTGAKLGDIKKALNKFELWYKIKYDKISWKTVKKRIVVDDRPFVIALNSGGKMGHVITGYGFSNNSAENMPMVQFWDSNGQKGAFKYGDTIYLYGIKFKWYATVH